MRRRLPLAVVVLSMATLIGACGGDDGKKAATGTTVATTPPTTAAPRLADVFKPVPGYTYVELPDSVLGEMRDQFASAPDFKDVVAEVEARSVTHNGDGVGIVMALRLDERYAALPGIEKGIISEFSQSAETTRTLPTAGDEVTIATDADGVNYLVWVNGDLVLMLIGPDSTVLIPVATSLITANN